MKRLTKAIVLTAAAVLVGQAARAQISAGDLILGFTSSAVTEDYVVDLGQPAASTSLGSLINLSQFNSAFTGGISSVQDVGVMFGKGTGATGDFAGLSVLRVGGNDGNGLAGTGDVIPTKPSSGGNVTSAATAANSTTLGTPANNTQLSFTGNANTGTAGSFGNNMAASPLVALSGSTISLDLFESTRLARVGLSTPASAYAFVGELEIDFSNGANPLISFVPATTSVPEPASYGVLAGAGLLIISLRRKLCGSNA